MSFTDLPIYFQGHALLTAMYILNKIPSKSVSTIPYEIWHGKKSSLSYLKTWGCLTYVKKQNADKLEDRSVVARSIGYLKKSIGYYFFFPHDYNVIVSHNATLLEKQSIQDDGSGRLIDLNENVFEERRAIDPQKPIQDE